MAEGFDWYEDRRHGLGHEFLGEVRSVLKNIAENPLRHAVIYRNVRRALVRRFPYKVFYYVEADQVEIIGVVRYVHDSPNSATATSVPVCAERLRRADRPLAW